MFRVFSTFIAILPNNYVINFYLSFFKYQIIFLKKPIYYMKKNQRVVSSNKKNHNQKRFKEPMNIADADDVLQILQMIELGFFGESNCITL